MKLHNPDFMTSAYWTQPFKNKYGSNEHRTSCAGVSKILTSVGIITVTTPSTAAPITTSPMS